MSNIVNNLISPAGMGFIAEGAIASQSGMFTSSIDNWKKNPVKSTAAVLGLGLAAAAATKSDNFAAAAALLAPPLFYASSVRTNKSLERDAAKKANTPLKKAMTSIKKHRVPIAFGAALGVIGYNLLATNKKKEKK